MIRAQDIDGQTHAEAGTDTRHSAARASGGRRLGALILFKAVWLGIVSSALWSMPALGAVAVAAHFAIEVLYYDRRSVVIPVVVTGIAGYLVDNLYVLGGLLSFPDAGPLPAPIWMALLWVNFALVLEPGMSWLHNRPALAAVLGAVGGPLAYSAGVGLDLIRPEADTRLVFGVVGVVWAIAMPVLVHFCRHGASPGARVSGR